MRISSGVVLRGQLSTKIPRILINFILYAGFSVRKTGFSQADFVLPLGVVLAKCRSPPLRLINDEHTRYTLTGLDLLLYIFREILLTDRSIVRLILPL